MTLEDVFLELEMYFFPKGITVTVKKKNILLNAQLVKHL